MKKDFTDLTLKTIKSKFNQLDLSVFQSLNRKQEIQFYIKSIYFPEFDVNKTSKNVDKNKINSLITELKRLHSSNFDHIYNYKFVGDIGPGEILLYFLVDNAHLAGGSQTSHDLIAGSNKYEIKSARISPDRVASDFRMSKSLKLDAVLLELYEMHGNQKNEISINDIKKLRSEEPRRFDEIEKKYKNQTYREYFKHHDIIFFNNRTKLIDTIKIVQENDIMIERVTGVGTSGAVIKPKIKL